MVVKTSALLLSEIEVQGVIESEFSCELQLEEDTEEADVERLQQTLLCWEEVDEG